ncbi:MAG: amidohydrolase family protein [Saprospiraceae bacterium]|nr:amidohydrolase family protein [Saprospiraceae bacterium]
MRAAGFVISHVAPRGLLLPGQSGIYLLGDGSNDKLLLKSPVAQNVQVLLSLELPEEEKAEGKKEDEKSAKKDTSSAKEMKKEIIKEQNPEKDQFDKKQKESVKEYLSQASVFEKNGIKFGFSFLNAKPSDIKKNLRRLIENGLSENYALAALTTHPAQMLGISSLAGTVDKGKLANLVITDKPYFSEKSVIKFVFVDGKKYDYSEKPKKQESKSSDSGKVDGLWSYTVEVPGSVQKEKSIFQKNRESTRSP